MNERGGLGGRPRRATLFALAGLVLLGLLALYVMEDVYRDVARRGPPPEPDAGHRVRVVLPGGRAAAATRLVVRWVAPDGSEATTETLCGRDGAGTPEPPTPDARPAELRAATGPLVAEVPAAPFLARGSLDVELALPESFTLAGRVRDARGAGVPAALVSAAGVSTVTDEHGEFKLATLPATAWFDGPLRITVRSGGRDDLLWPVPHNHAPAFYGDLTIELPE